MAVGMWVVFFVVLFSTWTLNTTDAVDCVLTESCVLPCSFPAGDEVLIHWIQVTADSALAHSYYRNQDQLGRQDERFTGRTSLPPKEQIARGNASLLLSGVKIQDQGRYKCYTSTITGSKEAFINLYVDAPVREVDIQHVGNRITCSSEGFYPWPELTWTTDPPSNVTLQNKTIHPTEQQLYNISSSLKVLDTDVNYICTVSTRRNNRRATLFKPTSINGSSTETTIPCTSSNAPLTRLIWKFNQSQIILNQMGADVPYTVSEQWRQQVKSLSESGSLTLQDLSSNQEGMYTCELSGAEETYVTNTFLMIEDSQGSLHTAGMSPGAIVGIILGLIVGGILAAIVSVVLCKRKGKRNKDQKKTESEDVTPLKQRKSPEKSSTSHRCDETTDRNSVTEVHELRTKQH